MNSNDYNEFTQDFLVKQFNDITVNITRNNEEVVAMTGYDNDQNMIEIPNEIIELVKKDITSSNK